MSDTFDIQAYMTHGVERVVGDIIKATFRNLKESACMVKFALVSRAASRKRRKAEDAGEYIKCLYCWQPKRNTRKRNLKEVCGQNGSNP